jgi:hypothetical protein
MNTYFLLVFVHPSDSANAFKNCNTITSTVLLTQKYFNDLYCGQFSFLLLHNSVIFWTVSVTLVPTLNFSVCILLFFGLYSANKNVTKSQQENLRLYGTSFTSDSTTKTKKFGFLQSIICSQRHMFKLNIDGHICWNSKRSFLFIVCWPGKTNFCVPLSVCSKQTKVTVFHIYISIYMSISTYVYLYLYILIYNYISTSIYMSICYYFN